VAAFKVQSGLRISSKLPSEINSVITGASETVVEASVVETAWVVEAAWVALLVMTVVMSVVTVAV
jgi:hypothetical protein